jgi:hypothetical protein
LSLLRIIGLLGSRKGGLSPVDILSGSRFKSALLVGVDRSVVLALTRFKKILISDGFLAGRPGASD